MKKVLSFVLAVILVVVYERPNKLGHQPDIQVDQANVNSRPDFSNREDKNVSAELEENKDSRLKNCEDIKLIDLCDEEYNELKNQDERINKGIKQYLLSFDNPSQVNDALTLLVKQQVISIPKAFRMMNYVEYKRALRGVVEINVNTPPSEAALSHLERY